MKITKEASKENKNTILKLFSCLCGDVILIGEPITKVVGIHNELVSFKCICPKCETQWNVKISFEEI